MKQVNEQPPTKAKRAAKANPKTGGGSLLRDYDPRRDAGTPGVTYSEKEIAGNAHKRLSGFVEAGRR